MTREAVTDLTAPRGGPERDALDLWLLPLSGLMRLEASLVAVVSDEERHACDRRTEDTARHWCLLQRGAARVLLSGYLGRPAPTLRFARADGGKPSLAEECADGLRFNLSHTGDLLAIVCARNMEVGVDVERLAEARPIAEIATRYFHPREAGRLETLDAASRRHQFFRWWTAKEALLKAQGLGISNHLSRLDLSPWTDQAAAEIAGENGASWFAFHPVEIPAHAVAVACARPPARMRILELT